MFKRFRFHFNSAGEARAQPSPADISDLVRATFPPSLVDSVLAKLSTYGIRQYEFDKEGVQLCILQLSAGDASKLDKLVRKAKSDFRDVLFSAHPHSSKLQLDSHGAAVDLKSPEARTAADEDLRSAGIWLLDAMRQLP
jgi:hypothetical protein